VVSLVTAPPSKEIQEEFTHVVQSIKEK